MFDQEIYPFLGLIILMNCINGTDYNRDHSYDWKDVTSFISLFSSSFLFSLFGTIDFES